jgi:hypothetical protein
MLVNRCPDHVIHDILKGIWRRVVHRAGIASTLEHPLCRLPGLAEGGSTSADGASRVGVPGDILLALPQGITIADASAIHPSTPSRQLRRLREPQQQEGTSRSERPARM